MGHVIKKHALYFKTTIRVPSVLWNAHTNKYVEMGTTEVREQQIQFLHLILYELKATIINLLKMVL